MSDEVVNRPDPILWAPTHRGDQVRVLGAGDARLIVLVPAAFTPVCSGELRDLSELAALAKQLGVQVLVVSCDTSATLAAWLSGTGVSPWLLGVSDHWPHGHIARVLGAFDGEHGVARRRSWAVRSNGSRKLVASSDPGEARLLAEHRLGVEWAATLR